MRRVCVVTGSRADYGLLAGVIQGIEDSPKLELQLVATGMHLSPEFGLTVEEIVRDGFRVAKRVDSIMSSDSPVGVAKSIGVGVIGFADALSELSPDVLVVLGDRYEVWAAAVAALPLTIPVVHIHGGERTDGAIDESIRHSLTKIAHLHCVANSEYRRRVLQLGENPDHVFDVGGLGVDAVHRLELLSRADLEAELGFPLGARSLLVTYHPVTTDPGASVGHMRELASALASMRDTTIVLTMPNADFEGRALKRVVDDFVAANDNAHSLESMGQRLYLSTLRQVDAVVGNSSSGLLEAPTLGTPTVNIGERQMGRLRATSVVDCAPKEESIKKALEVIWRPEFRAGLSATVNPYGSPGASARIVSMLERVDLAGLTHKPFYDLESRVGDRS
jgi:GDP/UDP-N,N'-diacetylbacillosamine 2-epimerase (hydrolysing)